MAYEELFKKIKDYESKWGKLGAGNSILNPEKTTISHSGLNSSNNFYGGKRKMLNMTNDYYEFRRKVAEGKKNNKLAHAATVDIDEINRQHWERINSDGTLIHVGGRYGSASSYNNNNEDDNYLEHAENVKYYQKIKLPNGQTRYFYTREEWDAYQNGQKQSEAESKRNSNGTMKDTAKRALEIPMRTTKDIINKNQAAKRMAEKNNEYTNDEGERYSTYESRQTKKEITGPNATKSKRIKHSFEDDDMNESIMSEYRAFKARADRGAEMNRLTHSSFISPSELNERYEEEIASHCFLAHAGGYGAPSGTNAYVAKIDDFYGKGKPRYFYSREEYDAYQRNAKGAQNAEKDRYNTNNPAQIEKKAKAYEKGKAQAEGAKQDEKARGEKKTEDASKLKGVWTKEEEKQAWEDYHSGKLSKNEKDKLNKSAKMESENGFVDPKEWPEKYQNVNNGKPYMDDTYSLSFGESGGIHPEENWMTPGMHGKDAEWTDDDEKEFLKRNQGIIDHCVEFYEKFVVDSDRLSDHDSKDEIKRYLQKTLAHEPEFRGEDGNGLNTNGNYIYMLLRDATLQRIKSRNNDRERAKEAKNRTMTRQNYANNAEAAKHEGDRYKNMSHSFEDNDKNTIEHSALDELNEFKAKVAMGKEKNRLAHSRMISLTELQHAASGKYGAPSGTNKYYAKLDDFYGKGKPRYFYTKEEWDGYQRNAKGASQAGADRAQKEKANNTPYDNKLSQDTLDFIEKQKQKKANYDKNKGYAENAEKDRWNKTIENLRNELKNAPTDIKDAPEPEPQPEIATKVETEVNKEIEQETRNIEEEATNYAVNVINNIIANETIQAYFNNACWHNVFGDSEGQMKEWNQIYDTEIAPRIDATINEAYQLYGPEYAAMLDQQIANLYEQMKLEYTTAYLSQRMALYGY